LATQVYTIEDVLLQDGKEVSLRPLNIKNLRKFMVKFKELENLKNDDDVIEFLVETAHLCLSSLYPEYSDVETFEDAVDMPTVHKIIEVCGGVKLNDPELIAAAAAAVATEQAGTN
jgi:hypothetical protein